MKVAFAGTPEFAQAALKALHEAGHEIVLVLTQPDRPAGRGMKLHASPVKQYALAHGLPVAQPLSLRLDGKAPEDAAQARAQLLAAAPEVMVVAAYGLLLPQWTLDLPTWGCLNIHASCLPRWRGAAPIHRAIEAGDTQTGISIMQMDAGLDTGAVISMSTCPIDDQCTTASLHDTLAAMGAADMVRVLASPGPWVATPQAEQGITYAHKIAKDEAPLNWLSPARVLARRVRAFDPFPGATLLAGEERVKVWQAHVATRAFPEGAQPGQLLGVDDAGVLVCCGDAVLCVTEVQRPGGRRMPALDWWRTSGLTAGFVLSV